MIPAQTLKNSIVDVPRLNKIIEYLFLTRNLPGFNAEVGVYKGGTAYLIASISPKALFLFDTFEGMPKVSDKDLHQEKDFNDTSLENVQKLLGDLLNVTINQGKFPENSRMISKFKFSFVHLDCDIYQSVKDSLEFFYYRMSRGGIICLDDYNEPDCPGAKLAVDEFLKDKPEKVTGECQSQVAIIKE